MRINVLGFVLLLSMCPPVLAVSCEPVLGLPSNGLQASLTTPKKSVISAEPIEVTLNLTNVGDERLVIDKREEYWRFVIHDENWNVVAAGPLSPETGRRPGGVMILEPGEHWERTIRPFEMRRFRDAAETWELQGEGIPPGRYWFGASYYAPEVNDRFWTGGVTTTNIDIEYLPGSAILHCRHVVASRGDLERCGAATRVTSQRLERYFPGHSFMMVDVESVERASTKMLTIASRDAPDEVRSCFSLDYENPSPEFLEWLAKVETRDKIAGLDLTWVIGNLLGSTVEGARTHSVRWTPGTAELDVRLSLELASEPLRDVVLHFDASWGLQKVTVEPPAVEKLPVIPR